MVVYHRWWMGEWMRMEHRWKDTDKGQPKCWNKNLPQCWFTHQIFHMNWPGIEPVPLWCETGEWTRRKTPPPQLIMSSNRTYLSHWNPGHVITVLTGTSTTQIRCIWLKMFFAYLAGSLHWIIWTSLPNCTFACSAMRAAISSSHCGRPASSTTISLRPQIPST
jgi:hypothetical protein